jgi:hypothetical protein
MPLFSSVTAEKNSPLERSRGRVHLIGGDFYYSPNSQRDVQLPLVYNDIPFRSCFKDSFAEFRQPLWWQPACLYLAFDQVLLVYPSRTFSISHILLAFAMEVS